MLDMGIIKIEFNLSELKEIWVNLRSKRENIFETLTGELRTATSKAISQIMDMEIALFLGRPEQLGNKRNGYLSKQYTLKGLGAIRVRVPSDRKRQFESLIIPKYEKIDPRIKEDLAVLHLAGISTRTLGMISRRIFGIEVGKDLISRSLKSIEEKAKAWINRPLEDTYWALYVDGTNFNLQRKGTTLREPTLIVLGVNSKNQKSILSMTPGRKEHAQVWKTVFNDLLQRGLNPSKVKIGIMDGLPGLGTVFKECFQNAVTARCWVHAKINAMNKCPARFREAFEKKLNEVMYSSSEIKARECFHELKTLFEGQADHAIGTIEKDLDSLLVHYRFEKKYWLSLKTTNPIERVNKELKRRSRSMGTMGPGLLESIQAFTALRLEMAWKDAPVDSNKLSGLQNIGIAIKKQNQIEGALTELLQ